MIRKYREYAKSRIEYLLKICRLDEHDKEALEIAIEALSQEPTKREIEREYLFQSLCEDFKKLQAENDDLRKRLEQEPRDDAISREDRLLDLANAIEIDDSGYWTNKRISSALRNISSVTQKCEKCAMNDSGSKYCDNCRQKSGKWIPVSERLPEKSDRYLAYIVNRHDDKLQYIMTCDYSVDGYWNWFPDAESASDNVVAWMPLPQPYKAESEE